MYTWAIHAKTTKPFVSISSHCNESHDNDLKVCGFTTGWESLVAFWHLFSFRTNNRNDFRPALNISLSMITVEHERYVHGWQKWNIVHSSADRRGRTLLSQKFGTGIERMNREKSPKRQRYFLQSEWHFTHHRSFVWGPPMRIATNNTEPPSHREHNPIFFLTTTTRGTTLSDACSQQTTHNRATATKSFSVLTKQASSVWRKLQQTTNQQLPTTNDQQQNEWSIFFVHFNDQHDNDYHYTNNNNIDSQY